MVPPRMSSASLATFPAVQVRDFQDGLDVDQVLLVRCAEACYRCAEECRRMAGTEVIEGMTV